VVAHRGASATLPEHTLAAYRRAIELGADALECDVRMTADGHLVCVHDRRVDRTSSGHGLVSTLELTQLQGLDWGSWKRLARADDAEEPFVVEPADDRSHLLTLRTLLEFVRDCGRDVRIAIETKHPTRYGGQVERELSRVLADLGWHDPAAPADSPVRVMSFSALAVRRMGQLMPAVPRALLIERVPVALRDGRLPRGVTIAAIGLNVLQRHPAYVERVHRAGGQVHVWVVDEPDDVELCRRARVEAIITNRPDVVLAGLGRSAPAVRPAADRVGGPAEHPARHPAGS
jgi:glycerophosphoryl diester phosphodiesterase